jgi:bifunctional DNA-binding transcriptional regulator/antitoxin component of YhaV-PrlF toxin-antitoxin module
MSPTKVVRTQAKGMVTIPVEFREKLGIAEDSLLQAELTNKGVLFVKLEYPNSDTAFYSDKEIEEWLEDDKLDAKSVKKLELLLKK